MKIEANTVDEYISKLPEDHKKAMQELRKVILKKIPKGFKEEIGYGMPSYVIPHSLYPAGYHCNPKLPLPFLSIASQKNFIAIYHMGIYADKKLFDWFTKEYATQCKLKLDIGKSCIRFKKVDEIPLKLIGELASKMEPKDWIMTYEKSFVKK